MIFEAIIVGPLGVPDQEGAILIEAVCLKNHAELCLKSRHPVFFIVQGPMASLYETGKAYRIPVIKREAYYLSQEDGQNLSTILCGQPEEVEIGLIVTGLEPPPPAPQIQLTPPYSPSPKASRAGPKTPPRPPRQIGKPKVRQGGKNRRYDFSG